jgi:hypothetical protein
VEDVEAGVGGELVVDVVLLYEVLDDIEVAAVGGVEEGGEAFVVGPVHPVGDGLLLVGLVEGTGGGGLESAEAFAGLFDEELDEVEVAFVGELVEDGVVLVVGELEQVEVGVLLQVVVELVDFAIGEEDLYDFALFATARGVHSTTINYY